MAQVIGASFGERLRQLREAAGLTQEELAGRAGLTAKGIAAIERGRRQRPYPHTVRALADALGLDSVGRTALLDGPAARPAAPATALTPSPLPVPPLPLIGREREVSEVRDFLGQGLPARRHTFADADRHRRGRQDPAGAGDRLRQRG